MNGSMIDLLVGPKRKKYTIHKDLLLSSSGFCQRNKEEYDLHEEIYFAKSDPAMIELLITWIYRQALSDLSLIGKDHIEHQIKRYIDLHQLAGYLEIDNLQNVIMDRLKAGCGLWEHHFSTGVIGTIYKRTHEGSPLRRFAVDSFLFKSSGWEACERSSYLELQMENGNLRFVLDCYEVLQAACAKSKIRDPGKRPVCAYHDHGKGKACCG